MGALRDIKDSSYPLDIEQAAETARLIDQDVVLTRSMGGLFPIQPDVEADWRVLDLACGPGGWILEVAREYPDMTLTGVDLSKTMINYAQALARVKLLRNVNFTVMDVTMPLSLADASFDFVNGRLLSSFMRQDGWVPTLQELKRILDIDGIFCLTEPAWPYTNSPTFETYTDLTLRALWLSGQSPSPDEKRLGITPLLVDFLHNAGYQDIQQRQHQLDFSAGKYGNHAWYENCRVAFKLLQPFLVKMKVTTTAEIEALYEQTMIDMLSDDFYGVLPFVSVWGRKPKL